MTIDWGAVSLAAVLVAAVGFFIKREFSRLDEMRRTVEEISTSVTMASEIRTIVGNMHDDHVRFFSDRGERVTIWKTIDDLKKRVEELEGG